MYSKKKTEKKKAIQITMQEKTTMCAKHAIWQKTTNARNVKNPVNHIMAAAIILIKTII